MGQYCSMTSVRAVEAPVESWPIVHYEGTDWYVARVYVPAVARADVPRICEEWGCEAPSKGLVDAIWRAADFKIDPWKMVRPPPPHKNMKSREAQEAHRKNMQSPEALEDQLRKLEKLASEHGDFQLLAGSHKDIAWVTPERLDLYGWHQLNGKVIEAGRTSHNDLYMDYSQGLRLVRRCGEQF